MDIEDMQQTLTRMGIESLIGPETGRPWSGRKQLYTRRSIDHEARISFARSENYSEEQLYRDAIAYWTAKDGVTR